MRKRGLPITIIMGEPEPRKRPGSLFMADPSLARMEEVTCFNPEEARSKRGCKGGENVGYEGITGTHVPWGTRGMPAPSGNRFKTADEGDEEA